MHDELRPLFSPQSIAVIGASGTPGKWGHSMVARPIQSAFRGPIYPINPKAKAIEGLTVYPNLRDVPGPVDMAVVTVPAAMVPDAVRDCAAKGVKAMVVPRGNAREAAAGGVAVWPVESLSEMFAMLWNGEVPQAPTPAETVASPRPSVDLADVRGQLPAKRGLAFG